MDTRYPAISELAGGGQPGDIELVFDALALFRDEAVTIPAVPAVDVTTWLRANERIADSVALVRVPGP